MLSIKKSLTGPALGLIIAALATPSFAQSQSRENQTSIAREAAIHECSMRASKYQTSGGRADQGASTDGRQTAPAANQRDIVAPWSPFERVYWTCMVEHGQHLLD
jgi:gas vesicle protein